MSIWHNKWTKREVGILYKHYPDFNKSLLLNKLPHRSIDAIKLKANSLKLFVKEEYSPIASKCDSQLEILLEDNPTSYYWIGFLMADGHFSRNHRLVISLAIKDVQHLEKFAKFIKCLNLWKNNRICTVSTRSSTIVPLIKKKFDISHRKTFNPPSIAWPSDDLFLSYLAGFIDGDGCIKKMHKRSDSQLMIKIHSSWLKTLVEYENRLYNILNYIKDRNFSKINSQGYASLVISDNYILSQFKKRIMGLRIPYLHRKWGKIKDGVVNKRRILKEREDKIRKILEEGGNIQEIANKLQLKYTTAYNFIMRRGLK